MKLLWIEDKLINNCCFCNKAFNILRRKHHCRSCGYIFCTDCLKKKICLKCLKYHFSFHNISIILELLNFNIFEYKKLSLVSKNFNLFYEKYLYNFKLISNKYYNYKYNENDYNLLIKNIEILKIYSKNYNKFLIIKENYENIRNYNKSKLNFNTNLNYDNIILLIYLTNNKFYIQKLLEKLYNFSINIYIDYFFINCHLLIYLSVLDINLYNFYKNLLKEKCLNYYFNNLVYWYFFFLNNKGYLVEYLSIINIDEIDNKIIDFFINIIQLKKICNIKNLDFINKLKIYLLNNNIKNFYMNIKKKKQLCKNIIVDDLIQLNSANQPLIIPFLLHNNNSVKFLFKQSKNLEKEYLILNLIKLINKILLEENLDLLITTYDIIPLKENYCFIELIEKSYTLFEIKEKYEISLQNFIFEKNPSIDLKIFKQNIIKSLAGHCLITYILGIEDRHLENIMITLDGKIFNIDFEFILNEQPLNTSRLIDSKLLKLTYEMIDAIGGIKSVNFDIFLNLFLKSFNIIKTKRYLLFHVLNLIPDLNESNIENFLNDKFLINNENIDLKLYFKNLILKSFNTFEEILCDFFHKQLFLLK